MKKVVLLKLILLFKTVELLCAAHVKPERQRDTSESTLHQQDDEDEEKSDLWLNRLFLLFTK